MPRLRRGPLQEFEEIPFDPDGIADLMRQGYQVFPDEGIDEDEFRTQDDLIRSAIGLKIARKEWGDQPLAPERKRFSLRGAMSLREDDSFGRRVLPPGSEERRKML
jgi:hypothetical protein